jgi:hypothetical protein
MKNLFATLDELLQKLWLKADNSLPGRHALTHMGGSDSVSGSSTPLPVVAGVDGAVGTPQLGFAPIDHQHELALGPIVPDLPDIIPGSPTPPFTSLRSELEFLASMAARDYALNKYKFDTFR